MGCQHHKCNPLHRTLISLKVSEGSHKPVVAKTLQIILFFFSMKSHVKLKYRKEIQLKLFWLLSSGGRRLAPLPNKHLTLPPKDVHKLPNTACETLHHLDLHPFQLCPLHHSSKLPLKHHLTLHQHQDHHWNILEKQKFNFLKTHPLNPPQSFFFH